MATISLGIEPVQPPVKPNIHTSDSKAIYKKEQTCILFCIEFLAVVLAMYFRGKLSSFDICSR